MRVVARLGAAEGLWDATAWEASGEELQVRDSLRCQGRLEAGRQLTDTGPGSPGSDISRARGLTTGLD